MIGSVLNPTQRILLFRVFHKSIVYLAGMILLLVPFPCFGTDSQFQLNPEEQAWINENHTVRVRVGHSPPFMLTDGKIQGIAIDYLTHIFNINGIRIKYISGADVTWPEALEYIKRHEVVDMVPTAKITEKRQEDMIFTDEYIFAPWVIFTKSDADFVSSIDDLNGKKVSVEEGYAMHQMLKKQYPGIKLKVVSASLKDSTERPIKDLSTGLVDAYIGNLLSATYTIQTHGYTNVKVAAPTPFDNHNQAMAIRSDWPELASIINKTLASMTTKEHSGIRNKWLSIRYEYGISRVYLLKSVLVVAGIAFLIIGFVLIWNKRLKREVVLREQIETALKESEEKYRALFNNAQVALFRTGISDGKLLEINQRYAHMAGYPTVEECMSEFNAANAWYDASGRDELVATLQENGFVLDYETQVIRKDKAVIWIIFSATIFPEKGYIEGSIVDITKRKQAEQALQEKTDFLDKIIESAALSTWISDEKGTAIRTNPACLEFFGATEKEVLGKYNIFQDAVLERNGFMPVIQGVFEKGRTANIVIDYDFRKVDHVNVKNATHKVINSILTPIADSSGKVSNVIVQTIDLTDIKRMERELNQALKMESIGNLAGGIAHDFNNILSSVIGYTELALGEVAKGTSLEDKLQGVYTAGKRARDLVKQILAFARQSDEERRPIRVDTIAEEVMKLMRSTIPSSIEIKQSIESNSLIMGNPSQIHQLLINLCTNAGQAMENTGGILEIGVTDVDVNAQSSLPPLKLESGSYVKITVSDTGCGIAPDIINSIFDPYFTTKGIGEGTGMGLALAHGIVEAYGGRITVDSALDKGSLFSVYLPITKTSEYRQPYEAGKLPPGTERILFVDDELPIVEMSSQLLERLGYQVTIRTSSVEALELFCSKPNDFDLVITDMTMPNMTGDELAKELMAFRADIPVILCTGYSKKITDAKAAQIGIKAVAYKPVVLAEFAETVRNVLDEVKG